MPFILVNKTGEKKENNRQGTWNSSRGICEAPFWITKQKTPTNNQIKNIILDMEEKEKQKKGF